MSYGKVLLSKGGAVHFYDEMLLEHPYGIQSWCYKFLGAEEQWPPEDGIIVGMELYKTGELVATFKPGQKDWAEV